MTQIVRPSARLEPVDLGQLGCCLWPHPSRGSRRNAQGKGTGVLGGLNRSVPNSNNTTTLQSSLQELCYDCSAQTQLQETWGPFLNKLKEGNQNAPCRAHSSFQITAAHSRAGMHICPPALTGSCQLVLHRTQTKAELGTANLGSCFNPTSLCYVSSIKPLNLSWEMGRNLLTPLGSLCLLKVL